MDAREIGPAYGVANVCVKKLDIKACCVKQNAFRLTQRYRITAFQAGQLTWKADAPSKQTLMTMLQSLERDGIITVSRVGAGRRSSIWWLPELIDIVERRR